MRYLAQLEADADLAEDRPALDRVEAALEAAGYVRPSSRRTVRPARVKLGQPLRLSAPDGSQVLVGRDSAQNQVVTFELATGDDLWLHAQGVPGAHVVIRCGAAGASPEALRFAAALAARHSAARNEGRVPVDYTLRRYVRPIKGGRPGMVTYREQQTLVVDMATVTAGRDGVEGGA